MLNELALFAGGGGGILGGQLLGWRTRCAVEIDPTARGILLRRQRDKMLPRFPIWDDVCTFDGKQWAGRIDVITGGFPCQDISAAGKGAGLAGARSGLAYEMLRIIGEVRPKFVLAENSPLLRTRGLGTIISALDGMGYDVRWGVLGAWHVGAPHRRNRMWIYAADSDMRGCKYGRPGGGLCRDIHRPNRKTTAADADRKIGVDGVRENGQTRDVADSDGKCRGQRGERGSLASRSGQYEPIREVADTDGERCDGGTGQGQEQTGRGQPTDSCGWPAEPSVGRVVDGVAGRVDRLRAIGNGQVPRVVATAWDILCK